MRVRSVEVHTAHELTAGFGGGGARKVCAWPKQAVFKGTGDGKSPDQFECK